jgi:hypothetical protein
MLTAYFQEGRVTIEKYNALSLINGLTYDRHSEIAAVEFFVGAPAAGRKHGTNPNPSSVTTQERNCEIDCYTHGQPGAGCQRVRFSGRS